MKHLLLCERHFMGEAKFPSSESHVDRCGVCGETTDVVSIPLNIPKSERHIIFKVDDGSTRIEKNGDGSFSFIKTMYVPKDRIPEIIERLQSTEEWSTE